MQTLHGLTVPTFLDPPEQQVDCIAPDAIHILSNRRKGGVDVTAERMVIVPGDPQATARFNVSGKQAMRIGGPNSAYRYAIIRA
jgi:hypothetical protein